IPLCLPVPVAAPFPLLRVKQQAALLAHRPPPTALVTSVAVAVAVRYCCWPSHPHVRATHPVQSKGLDPPPRML
ncbi:hypothetical protein DHEL01_v210594, partial [Diaporthe helianthi]